nr:laccase-12-like [Tanacetum cinerariifolium]
MYVNIGENGHGRKHHGSEEGNSNEQFKLVVNFALGDDDLSLQQLKKQVRMEKKVLQLLPIELEEERGQEGTLWHAHSSWLRATIYGSIIIHPREGYSYPFPKPKHEAVIALGKWWDENPIDVIREATRTLATLNVSDAYTINGQLGNSYNSSRKDTVIMPVESGETNLL